MDLEYLDTEKLANAFTELESEEGGLLTNISAAEDETPHLAAFLNYDLTLMNRSPFMLTVAITSSFRCLDFLKKKRSKTYHKAATEGIVIVDLKPWDRLVRYDLGDTIEIGGISVMVNHEVKIGLLNDAVFSSIDVVTEGVSVLWRSLLGHGSFLYAYSSTDLMIPCSSDGTDHILDVPKNQIRRFELQGEACTICGKAIMKGQLYQGQTSELLMATGRWLDECAEESRYSRRGRKSTNDDIRCLSRIRYQAWVSAAARLAARSIRPTGGLCPILSTDADVRYWEMLQSCVDN